MTTAREVIRQVAPKLAQLNEEVLFGDVWERPELSKRDRSLITHSVPDFPVPHWAASRPLSAGAGQRPD